MIIVLKQILVFRRWYFFGATLLTFFLPFSAAAHERWLVSPAGLPPSDVFGSFHWSYAVALLIVVLVLVAARSADQLLRTFRFGGVPSRLTARLKPWISTLIGLATAVSVTSAGLNRAVLQPHLTLPDTSIGTLIVAAELLVGLCLFVGFAVRPAAVVLIGLVFWAVAHTGLRGIDTLSMVGIGVFLLVWGRGRLSLAAVFSRIVFAMDTGHMRPVALTTMRVMLGIGLLWLALDHVLHPELFDAVLQRFPNNPLQLARVLIPSLSFPTYMLCTVAVEITLGLLLVTGWLARLAALATAIVLLLLPFWFGGVEAIGHAPIISAAIAVVLLGRTAEREEDLRLA